MWYLLTDVRKREGMFCDSEFAAEVFNVLVGSCNRQDYDEDCDLDDFHFAWDGGWWVEVDRDEEENVLTLTTGITRGGYDEYDDDRVLGTVVVGLEEVREILRQQNGRN